MDEAVEKLASGGSLLFFGLVAELGISFLAKVVIARVLGPIDYGAVSLGVTTMIFLSTFTVMGLNAGVGRYLPRYEDPGDRRGVVVSAFQVAMPVSVVVGVAIAALSGPIARYAFHDPAVAPYLLIFGLAIPFGALMRLATGAIQGMQLAVPKVIVQNVTPPVTRFGAVLLAVGLGFGALGIATAYALAYVLAGLVGLYYVVRKTPLLDDVRPTPMRRELLRFSAPLVVTAAMSFVLGDVDTFMLGYFADTGAVGVYNVIYPISQLLTMALGAIGFMFMPVISSLDAEGATAEMHRTYQVVTKWVFMATLPVFLVVALFPTMTITVTFGGEYAVGAAALSVLAVAYFSHAIAGPNANVLTAIGNTRTIMWDNVAIATLNVVLNLVLIPRYGYYGAAVATAASYILLNVLYSTQLYRETGIHPFSTGLVRPGFIASVLVAVVYWVTRTFFQITVPLLVGMFVVFMVLYAVVILRFGGIEDEEIMLVLSFEERFGVDLGPLKTVAKAVMNG
ncbi:MAG: flippase [Halanaeroarchaeum sp.]